MKALALCFVFLLTTTIVAAGSADVATQAFSADEDTVWKAVRVVCSKNYIVNNKDDELHTMTIQARVKLDSPYNVGINVSKTDSGSKVVLHFMHALAESNDNTYLPGGRQKLAKKFFQQLTAELTKQK
jgi:hypothetical protein